MRPTPPARTTSRWRWSTRPTPSPAETKSRINGTAQVASYTGAYVVFSTDAALVPWDDNGTDDVYLRSRPDGFTVLVSGKGQKPGNDASFEPTISDDGRWVAYTTFATNLAQDTSGGALDVVVRDMQSTKTVLVSQSTAGKPGTKNSFCPVISGNGRHVSFQTFSRLGPKDQDKKEDVYVRNLKAGTTKQVSLLPDASRDVRDSVLNGDVSDNGRLITFGNAEYVAFSSCAEDLPGSGDVTDIYRASPWRPARSSG